jgi:hypothetical protein
MIEMFISARNCCATRDVCFCAWSWCRNYCLYHLSRRFLRTASRNPSKICTYEWPVTLCLGGTKSLFTIPTMQNKSGNFLTAPRIKTLKDESQRLNKQNPWSESASELYRPSDRRLSAKWLPTFAEKECQVVSVTDPYGRILGFLDRSRYFSIK